MIINLNIRDKDNIKAEILIPRNEVNKLVIEFIKAVLTGKNIRMKFEHLDFNHYE